MPDQIATYDSEYEMSFFATVDVMQKTPPHLDPEGSDGWKCRVAFFREDATSRPRDFRMIHKVGVVGVTRAAADAAADEAKVALSTLGIEVREKATA